PQILNRIEVRRMRRPNLTVDLCDSTAAGMSSGSITAEWATVVVQHLPATPREKATAFRQDICIDDLDHLLPIETLIKVKLTDTCSAESTKELPLTRLPLGLVVVHIDVHEFVHVAARTAHINAIAMHAHLNGRLICKENQFP